MNIGKLLEEARIELPRIVRSTGEARGAWSSLFRGEGIEPEGLRPYKPGDSPRAIQPRSIVRAKELGDRSALLVRQHARRTKLSAVLCVDLSPFLVQSGGLMSPYAMPSRTSALMFAVVIASAAYRWQVPIRFLAGSEDIVLTDPVRETAGLIRALEGIERISPRPASRHPISAGAWEERLSAIRHSLIFFVSGFADGAEELVSVFKRARDIRKNDIIPVYLDTSWIWEMVRGVWETGGVTTDARGRERIAQEARERRSAVDRACTEASLPWIHLTEPILAQIQERATRCFVEKTQRS